MKPTMLNSSGLPREFSRSPMVIAHRGGAGDRPENTLEACAFALENGANALELDIQLTEDGVPVVFHDPIISRTLGAHKTPKIHGARHLRPGAPMGAKSRVNELSYAKLAELDAGYFFGPPDYPWRGRGVIVPTLEQLFATFPNTPIILDLKKQASKRGARHLSQKVGELIQTFQREGFTIVSSFNDYTLLSFRSQFPQCLTGAGVLEVAYSFCLHLLGFNGARSLTANAIQIPIRRGPLRIARFSFIRKIVRQGRRVDIWTVNNPQEMSTLLQAGVTGLITDFPQRARTVMDGSQR